MMPVDFRSRCALSGRSSLTRLARSFGYFANAICFAAVFGAACVSNLDAQDLKHQWSQFRGNNSSGVAKLAPPIEFGLGVNVLWKVRIGAGHSSPCIVGNRIFVTTFDRETGKVALVCLDRSNGKTIWSNDTSPSTIEKGHPSFNPASSTPASDGEIVVAYFGSYGLICYDVEGKFLWDLKMPVAKSFGGNATSPAIIGDQIILYRGTYVDHYLLAVESKTGKERWKVPQDEPFTGEMACTACPITDGEKLIVHTARGVQAFNLSDGNRIWFTKCATTATSTPIISGDEVLVAAWNKMGEPDLRPAFPEFKTLVENNDSDDDQLISPKELPDVWIFHRPQGIEAPMNGGKIRFDSVDKNKDRKISKEEWDQKVAKLNKYRSDYQTHGILAIPLNSKGYVDAKSIRTLEKEGIPEVPSPICDLQHIYVVKNGGVLTCIDLKTGQRASRIRTGGKGTHYASPLLADGKLFTFAGNGKVSVIQAGADLKVLATNDVQDSIYATPAIVDGVIYIRTHKWMFAFGK